MTRIHLLYFFSLFFLGSANRLVCAQDDNLPEHFRRYADGPLAAEDFRGTVPNRRPTENGVRLDAYTAVDIAYNVRYRSQISASRTTLTLTSIDVSAVLDQSQSWNTQKSNPDLLKHEQGHFDLAAIAALRLQLEFETQLNAGRGITTVGANETDAALALRREIDRLIRSATDEMIKANQQYDAFTANGSKREAQQQQRKQQLDELSRLVEELKKARR